MIQGSINQLLTLAAAGAKLSPEMQKRVEIKDKIKEGEELEKQEHAVAKAGSEKVKNAKTWEEFEEATAQLNEAKGEYLGKRVTNAKELFDLKPTEESYKEYRYLRGVHQSLNTPATDEVQDPAAEAERKADEALAAEQRRVGRQRVHEFKQNAKDIVSPKKRGTIKYDNI